MEQPVTATGPNRLRPTLDEADSLSFFPRCLPNIYLSGRGLKRLSGKQKIYSVLDKNYNLIVIGSGPAGEKAAIEAAKLRKSTAIVERRSVQGGVCLHTGTIPSKTLREVALYVSGLRQRTAYGIVGGIKADLTMRELMSRKDQVIQAELDVIQQNMAKHRIEVIAGHGMLTDPHTVIVSQDSSSNRIIKADVIIISTGTHSYHPPHVPFDHKFIYDAESIINLDMLPRTLLIVGGGVIGCEYASIFAQLGVRVMIVDPRKELLTFLDHEISEALSYLMRKYGITLILGESAENILVEGNETVTITKSGRRIIADRILYTAGRRGNTDDMGLEALGVETDDRGQIKVDANYRTNVPSVYAVGDVIGFPSLASVSMDQGRLAAMHAFGSGNVSCLNTLLPFGLYTIPEVSLVGETEESLSANGQEYEVGVARYFELSRGQIINDHDGMLKLIFDPKSLRLHGVHIIGDKATELIHIGQAVMTLGGTLDYFMNTVFNYPTLSEAYKVAAMDGFSRLRFR